VSILIDVGAGVGRYRGSQPRAKTSMNPRLSLLRSGLPIGSPVRASQMRAVLQRLADRPAGARIPDAGGLLKAGIGAAATLAAPRIGGAAAALVVVPTADLVVLDPVVTFNRPTRNYAYLVFDTLYGLDTRWQAQPQMVEGHEVEDDGLTWLLRLREGLRFHDNEPVLAKDVVASIRCFAVRVPFASALMAATDELSAVDDRSVKFRLKRPFPHLPMALAGPGGTVPAIMPDRLAATSPHQPVKEAVGSGPFRLLSG
jgi:peptide/nickel transport system substrate-binding protein